MFCVFCFRLARARAEKPDNRAFKISDHASVGDRASKFGVGVGGGSASNGQRTKLQKPAEPGRCSPPRHLTHNSHSRIAILSPAEPGNDFPETCVIDGPFRCAAEFTSRSQWLTHRRPGQCLNNPRATLDSLRVAPVPTDDLDWDAPPPPLLVEQRRALWRRAELLHAAFALPAAAADQRLPCDASAVASLPPESESAAAAAAQRRALLRRRLARRPLAADALERALDTLAPLSALPLVPSSVAASDCDHAPHCVAWALDITALLAAQRAPECVSAPLVDALARRLAHSLSLWPSVAPRSRHRRRALRCLGNGAVWIGTR